MTRDHYQTAAKRMQRITCLTCLVFAGPVFYLLALAIDAFASPLTSYGAAIRSRFGEAIGGAIGGLTAGWIASIPLLIFVGVMLAIDRRFGVRCPHCHRSLTARCLPEHVLESGECSLCHKRVFDESGAA